MIRRCAVLICGYLEKQSVIESADRELYEYGLECLLATQIQNILLLILSVVFQVLPQTVIFALTFGAVKRWAGGFHAGSHFSCMGISTLLTLGMAALSKNVPVVWSPPCCLFALLLAGLLIWRKAPVQHPSNPKTREQLVYCRRRALITYWILTTLSVLSLAIFPALAFAGALGMLGAAITLLL